MEGVQEKVVNTSKDIYSVMTDTQEKAGEVFKGAFSEVSAVKPASAKAGK